MVAAKRVKEAEKGKKSSGSATNIPLRPSVYNDRRVPLWVPVLLCLSILLFDISTPKGMASGIAYIPLVFCGLWFSHSYSTFIFAAVASLLAIIAFPFKPPSNVDFWIGIMNRALAVSALWFVALLVYLRRKTETALKNSEERYELAVQGLSVGIWDWNPNTNELYWSPKFKEIIGCTDEVLPDHYNEWESRLHPEDRERTLKMLYGHLERLGPYDIEYRLRKKDGGYNWIHAKGQAVWDRDGKPLRMVGSIDDISDRKEAERQKQRDAMYLEAVMNTIIDGLITIDDKGTIQSLNPAAVKLFGYAPEEVIGQNVKMLMPEPYHSEHDGYLRNYLDTGKAKVIGIGREVTAKRKDGSIFAMELGINEMRVDDKRMFVGTTRDVSARKMAEQKLQRALKDLKQSNDELEAFAYIASHDLKEPLRGLANNATILKEDCGELLDTNIHKRLNRMAYLCQRMERLVDDLLYFSRLGRQEMAIRETNLHEVIKDIEIMMENTLNDQNAKIVIPKPLPEVVCDAPRITEVFRNLITNAVKYNKSKDKVIEIGCTETPATRTAAAEQVFYVRDNGIGIAPEFYDDIFRIFKRLNEEDDSVKGTGVGLTFVRKIIERHGGRIWLESKIGEGTTFYFTLNATDKGDMAYERLAANSSR